MRLVPQSTFARVTLLVAGVIAATVLAAALLLGRFASEQRIAYLADRLVELSQPVLQVSAQGRHPTPQALRQAATAAGLALRVVPESGPPPPPHLLRYTRALHDELVPELGADLELQVVMGRKPSVWLRSERTGGLWLGLPLKVREPRPPVRVLTWLGLVALLTFAGAWLLTRSFTRPLAQLAEATRHIARGEPLPELPSGGPREARELARALTEAAAEASRLARDRELLLAGVSHDLRTPLARLRMAIELLPSSGHGADLREGMTLDVEEMDAIIGQFLALVREGQEEPVAPVVLDQLAREVVEARRREGHQIQLELAAPQPVPGRRTALQRALGNLLSNALSHGRPPVTVFAGDHGGYLTLGVRDHGPGIDPERLPALLRPFAAAGGEGRRPGEGLGLAVVERTARLHGGEVRSEQGQGGFEIRLEWPGRTPA